MGWNGTIEYQGKIKRFDKAPELALRMIEIYQDWYVSMKGFEPTESEISLFFNYRPAGMGIIKIKDHALRCPNDHNNWYTDESIRIYGEDYFVQQWEVDALSKIERIMRDRLHCNIHRYCDGARNIDYAYKNTKYNDARKCKTTGGKYALPGYTKPLPELIIFYKTTIKYEDRVLWLENDVQRDLLDILEFSTRLFSRDENIPAPAVILRNEFKTSTITFNPDNPLYRLRERLRNEENRQNIHHGPHTKEMHVWGDYDEKKNLISIYYKTIMNDCGSEKEFRSSVRWILAHEFFHAYYYYTVPQIKAWSNEYEKERITEAMAEFFSLLWGIEYDKDMIKFMENRFNEWIDLIDYDWPYSYALFFFTEPRIVFHKNFKEYETMGSIDKFMKVYQETDERAAYDILRW